MSSLIIHNDKSPLLEYFNQIKFSSTSDIDKYITNFIIPKIKEYSIDKIYIKDNLSSNYLELYGLRVAYHIRLSEELGDKRYLPIVILSDVDRDILNALDSMARILFTKNIFVLKNTKEAVKNFKLPQAYSKLPEDNFNDKFLKFITVEPPENSTSHSIANEWAIDRWAEFLNIENNTVIDDNREKISSMLYFKYLKALNPLERNQGLVVKVPKLNGKILYIDDEWDKGWSTIFEKYFPINIEFETFEKNFKDSNIYSLQSEIKDKIINNTPDVVLLDLRLIEKDHTREEIENLAGIKITQMIKEINPGIQVIIFTATNKSRILEKLYKHKILGYIKKAHPEDKNLNTKESFATLAELVDKGLEKKYLKEIWDIQDEILKLNILKRSDANFIKIKAEIETIFEILDSDLENKIKFTILTIFKILEILSDKFKLEGSEIKKITTLFKKNNLNTYCIQISQLICTRNFLVHSGSKKKLHRSCIEQDNLIEKPEVENILTWFKMLQTILEAVSNDKTIKTRTL